MSNFLLPFQLLSSFACALTVLCAQERTTELPQSWKVSSSDIPPLEVDKFVHPVGPPSLPALVAVDAVVLQNQDGGYARVVAQEGPGARWPEA